MCHILYARFSRRRFTLHGGFFGVVNDSREVFYRLQYPENLRDIMYEGDVDEQLYLVNTRLGVEAYEPFIFGFGVFVPSLWGILWHFEPPF